LVEKPRLVEKPGRGQLNLEASPEVLRPKAGLRMTDML
jgi:hypothetical protein